MLGPKVASHVTRAASTTLHGSQSTLRNVWHSNNSNLGWNDRFFDSNGYNYRSNRSSSTFHQAGRAVTQANTGSESSSIDLDDQELEHAPSSSAVTLSHAPVSSSRPRSLRSRTLSRADISLAKILLKRCNHAWATLQDPYSVTLPPQPPQATFSSLATDPAAPQSVIEPASSVHDLSSASNSLPSEFLARLASLQGTKDWLAVQSEVQRFLDEAQNPTVEEFNAALQVLAQARQPGETVKFMLEVYNAMIDRSLYPTPETYLSLIDTLLCRDDEVSRLVASHNVRSRRHTKDIEALTKEEARIQAVLKETNFTSAYSLFQAILTNGGGALIPTRTFEMLLRSCSHHGDPEALIQIYTQFEALNLMPTPLMFRYMIQTMTSSNRGETVTQLFEQFQAACQQGKLEVVFEGDELSEESHFAIMQVYNQTIEAYFRLGQVDKAVDLFGTMVQENARAGFTLGEVPTPSSSTCTCVIAGWINRKDIQNAEKWFSMLLQQSETSLHPLKASQAIPRPDRIAWSLMLDALAKASAHEPHPAVDVASTELPWATSKLVEYSQLWFSQAFPDKQSFLPRTTEVTQLVTVTIGALTGYQETWRDRESLPDGWEQELEKVQELCSTLVHLTAGPNLSAPHIPSQAAWAIRSSIGTLVSAAQMVSLLSPSNPLRPSLHAQTLDLIEAYMATISERDDRTQALMVEQAVKALSFIVAQLGPELNAASLLRISTLATQFGSKKLDASIGSYVVGLHRQGNPVDSTLLPETSDWAKVLSWLAADVYDRRGPALATTSTPDSPELASDTSSVASSTPSLESFEGSEATEETAPDLQAGSPYTFVPEHGLISSLLAQMAATGRRGFSDSVRSQQIYILKALVLERGNAEETYAYLQHLGFEEVTPADLGISFQPSLQTSQSDVTPLSQPTDALENAPSAAPTRSASPIVEQQVTEHSTASSQSTTIPIHVPSRIVIDQKVTRQIIMRIDSLFSRRGPPGSQDAEPWKTAYELFLKNFESGRSPDVEAISRLVEILGRWGGLHDARVVYSLAQEVLNGPLSDKGTAQTHAWYILENSMIISHAYADDLESAHVHRMRIMDQGMTPNADAYASLILKVQDTTDDTSNAMTLFAEARSRGVQMNTYLYNNIISKLAKARKADLAVELFHQMRAEGLTPSSITYGTVIGACVRVGDVHSAETLFMEMSSRKNFKPRVPPYNHMMQLYTSIRPDRERALYFFEQMKAARVEPSAHTYKLLLDAYGSCEPCDPQSMERVFEQMTNGSASTQPHGGHINSVITAYGVKMGNLEKAREVFATATKYVRTRDAVIYEAMFDVLRAHGKINEVESHIEAMNSEGVHMTAYIANVLIGLYSDAGRLEKARGLFESMQDPPSYVAASGNHAPHDPNAVSVDVLAPVYREPSTWEAMIIAEAKGGDFDAAQQLLSRMEQRQYPPQVYYKLNNLLQQYASPTGEA